MHSIHEMPGLSADRTDKKDVLGLVLPLKIFLIASPWWSLKTSRTRKSLFPKKKYEVGTNGTCAPFFHLFSKGMPNMGGMGNGGGPGAMFTGPQEMGNQMGSPMGSSMSNILQNAIGGGIPGMTQKRTKMGKVHKIFSKLSKRKNVKKHHKN